MTALVGWLAAIVASVMFLPQVVRTWRQRHEPEELAGISLSAFGLIILSGALWLTYGVLKSDPQIIVTNSLTAAASITTIAIVVRGRRKAPVPQPS